MTKPGKIRSTLVIAEEEWLQLGNRLFSFAHILAFAEENKLIVYNPAFYVYAAFFKGTNDNMLCRYPYVRSSFRLYWLRKFFSSLVSHFASLVKRCSVKQGYAGVVDIGLNKCMLLNSPEFIQMISSKKLVICKGWEFRDSRSLIKHADKIRSYFELADIHKTNVQKLSAQVSGRGELVIGIHIRRRDYAVYKDGKYYYSIDQYRQIMRRVESIFQDKRIVFLICSDEPLDAKSFEGFCFEFGTGHLVEDMYSFAECDYMVGPPSTFTLWSSFYGKVPLCRVYDPGNAIAEKDFSIFSG